MDREITRQVCDEVYRKHAQKIRVILRASKIKGSNFDPFRQIGFEKTSQNPLFINAVVKTLAPNSLIIREMGLTESGAVQILIRDKDVALIKLSKVLIIDDVEYYVFNDRIGNRLQIFPLKFGYSKIIVFRKDK